MKMPTASKVGEARRCPPSALLPHVSEEREEALAGTRLHEVLVLLVESERSNSGVIPALTSAEREWAEHVVERMPELMGAAFETTYSWDVLTETAELLGSKLDRNYPALPSSTVVGTADAIIDHGNRIEIVDLKTGLTPLGEPHQLPQLRALAAMVAHWYKLDVQVTLLHAPAGQTPWIARGPIWTPKDIKVIETELLDLFDRLLVTEPIVKSGGMNAGYRTGQHCTNCPAFEACPAMNAWIRRLAQTPDSVERDVEELINHQTASLALDRLELIEGIAKRLRSSVSRWAVYNPIQRADGRVLGNHTVEREEFDTAQTFDFLKDNYGLPVVREAFSFETSKTAITRAVGATAPRGAKSRAAQAALQALRELGAVTIKKQTRLEVHTPALSSTIGLPVAASLPPTTSAPVFSEVVGPPDPDPLFWKLLHSQIQRPPSRVNGAEIDELTIPEDHQ